MTMWMFWAIFCLVIGQLVHSLPTDDQRVPLDGVVGTAESVDKSSPRFSRLSRLIRSNNQDNDDLNFLHNVERRAINNYYQQRVFDLTNQARQQGRYCGQTWYPATTPLSWNDQLGIAAQKHAESMLYYNYFSHTGRDGSSFVDRIAAAGYSRNCAGGENIAGNQTPEATVASWIKSSGHCANIMNKNFRAIGIGYAKGGPYGAYWVQNFGYC
ncbi:unnamed protein product [Rotaria sp. Silwood1]|nr:unnamed protein product [Rotaria sp. Silwood1]CAF3748292.1 unnamed protein product [Rotaria sp. Silwood1]